MNEYNYYHRKTRKNNQFSLIGKIEIKPDISQKIINTERSNNKISFYSKLLKNENDYIPRKNYNENTCKLSSYIIKPYQKRLIIVNPLKKEVTNKNIIINSFEINNNSNSLSERINFKSKRSNDNEDNNTNISTRINLNKIFNSDKFNYMHDEYDKKQKRYDPLITVLYNKKNHIMKDISFNKKEKINGNVNNRKYLKYSLTPEKLTYVKYQRRLIKALLLFLEKYYETHLIKIKYLFFSNLKNFRKKAKLFKNNIYKRNKEILGFCEIYPTELEKDENDGCKYSNNYFLNILKNKREKNLLCQIKDRNISLTPDKINHSELCRNQSELIKMKEIIKRRKKRNSKNNANSNEENESIQNKKNFLNNHNQYKIIKKNKSIDNIKKLRNKYKRKNIIVKNLCTKDKKIFIDIKYLNYMNFINKKEFKDLKIIKDFSIDLIGNSSNNQIIIQKEEYKYSVNKMNDKSNIFDQKNLYLIKEEEEKLNNEDKAPSKNLNDEKDFNNKA